MGSTFPESARQKFLPPPFPSGPVVVRGPALHPPLAAPVWSRPAAKLGKTLTLRAHFDSLTGYGQLACGLLRELTRRGIPCQGVSMAAKVWEPAQWGKHACVGKDIHALFVPKNEMGWEVMMASPHHAQEQSPSIALSMWESNRLPEGTVEKLNQHQAIINPSRWGLESWDAAGVARPMYRINLPLSDVFREYRPLPQSGPFTFGMACRRAHGGLRKGVVQACECFLAAFSDQKDVRLRLKFYPDCSVSDIPQDPRIEIIQEAYTDEQMAEFLASLHCYVSTSQAEGYGLVQCQAMGVGRPVLGAMAHAQRDYLSESCSWLTDYELRDATEVNPANGYYRGFVYPLLDGGVVRSMHLAYSHRDQTEVKGKLGNLRAQQMTWERFGYEFLAALKKEGLPV